MTAGKLSTSSCSGPTPDPFYAPCRRTGGRGGGEGPNHKALREWVQEHPECIDKRLRDVDAETEGELLSGDRVDVRLPHAAPDRHDRGQVQGLELA